MSELLRLQELANNLTEKSKSLQAAQRCKELEVQKIDQQVDLLERNALRVGQDIKSMEE
jgi:hypothetical protein